MNSSSGREHRTVPASGVSVIEAGATELARLVALIDSSGDAIVGLTLAGIITSWNRGAVALYGYFAVEAVTRPIAILLPADRRNEAPGDTLVLFTDGGLDSGLPLPLQQEGVEDLLRGFRGFPVGDIVDGIHDAVVNAQRDDVAIAATR